MAPGADEPPLGNGRGNDGPRRRQQEIGAAGPEADDDDTPESLNRVPFRPGIACCHGREKESCYHPPGEFGSPGVPDGAPGNSGTLGGVPVSERCVLGCGGWGGTTTGTWPGADGSNVP